MRSGSSHIWKDRVRERRLSPATNCNGSSAISICKNKPFRCAIKEKDKQRSSALVYFTRRTVIPNDSSHLWENASTGLFSWQIYKISKINVLSRCFHPVSSIVFIFECNKQRCWQLYCRYLVGMEQRCGGFSVCSSLFDTWRLTSATKRQRGQRTSALFCVNYKQFWKRKPWLSTRLLERIL